MKKLIEGSDYCIFVVDFPDSTIGGAVIPNDDGTFSVYINSRRSFEAQVASLYHELAHISGNDFYNGLSIGEVEQL